MTEQARNTERHVQGWGNTKLREQGISFISAGKMNEEEEEEEDVREETAQGQDQDLDADRVPGPSFVQDNDDQLQGDSHEVHDSQSPPEPVLEPRAGSSAHDPILDMHVEHVPLDVSGQMDANPISTLAIRHSRSASSSSSEADQIVFRGRQQSSVPPSAPASRARSTVQVEEKSPPRPAEKPKLVPVISQPAPVRQNSRRQRRGRGGRSAADEDAIMQDYIANMAMDDSDDDEEDSAEAHKTSKPVRKNEHFRFFEGSGEDNVKVKTKRQGAASKNVSKSMAELVQALDWDSEDLEIFDDFSTTDDDISDVEQVLRQRERSRGSQYLVTAKGADGGDPKWVSSDKLISESARREILIFEEIQAMEFEENSFDEDEDEDESTDEEAEQALNDLIGHIESEDDENARILEHASRMTDEQIARALAKQEELGLGSDELMLFNGDVGDDDDDMEDAFGANDDFVSFSLRQHTSNRGRSKRNKKRDTFPSAEAFADALDQDPYGAFDVMDFDRPSLRPKKKGRKSDFPYDLEIDDDDLKDQLVSTWARDREKKASRKREKEEARMSAAIDASERNEPAAIKAEIRRFLVQEVDVLRLAPMDSHVRASVHRLAKALKLNSRSEGKEGKGATGRFPVLTKTARTPSYTIDTIWEIDALMNTRKFFPKHMGFSAPKVPRAAMVRSKRGGGGVQGASYMNGEVVGASAPELGADNKGRLLLEKMGWSTGMGIGKEGNKGSLESIKHVVKTTKAGLG